MNDFEVNVIAGLFTAALLAVAARLRLLSTQGRGRILGVGIAVAPASLFVYCVESRGINTVWMARAGLALFVVGLACAAFAFDLERYSVAALGMLATSSAACMIVVRAYREGYMGDAAVIALYALAFAILGLSLLVNGEATFYLGAMVFGATPLAAVTADALKSEYIIIRDEWVMYPGFILLSIWLIGKATIEARKRFPAMPDGTAPESDPDA